MAAQTTKSAATRRGKTAVAARAANRHVYGVLAAGLHDVNKSVSGNVSGRSNQKPYKAANFSALVVYVGTH
jgi:hypothetical protein